MNFEYEVLEGVFFFGNNSFNESFSLQTEPWSTNGFFVRTSAHEHLEALVEYELFHKFLTSLDYSTIKLLLVFWFSENRFHSIDEELSFVDDFISQRK